MLASAGLRTSSEDKLPEGLIPPTIAAHAVDYPASDKRISASVDIDDPALRQRANEDWYRLSIEGGLFTREDPRFYVALQRGEEDHLTWIHAELMGSWDIMGAGANGPLGSGYCRPEFVMLSLNGKSICCGTTWQFAIGTVVITAAAQSPFFRNYAEGVVKSTWTHPEVRESVLEWLQFNTP
jgi:hypothetical protein